ncbi:hypothetical protein V2S04_07330 [Microbacterium sp. OR21]|uniref:hypothetical protein n=1 Tax=Microbacterium sp. OR21 TaxID=3095346 RepID=UPI0039B65A76
MWWAMGIAFVLGGAIVNVRHRLIPPPGFGRGHVTDFLAYGNWFIGNLAAVTADIPDVMNDPGGRPPYLSLSISICSVPLVRVAGSWKRRLVSLRQDPAVAAGLSAIDGIRRCPEVSGPWAA